MIRFSLLLALSLCYFCAFGQCFDVIVSQAGDGDFTTIQEAIDASGGSDSLPFRIFIRNGIYEEKLFFEKSHIVLIGESRDETIITTAVLRRAWREDHPDDWGAATVNIRNQVTDLTFANLTIRNNFADVFPGYPDPNDHSFALRGGGHRIILYNCNVTSTGGDTVSLWNTDGGMFYHSRCYFEGYVDFLAPRGYCYITDSEFFGHNATASIWHDGSGGEDHKFVIHNSLFDGVPGFALGRHHRDAQFYLLDCWFSENMKNQEIYWEARDEIQWSPDRKYYYNVHRPEFDWPWHRDNLHFHETINSPDEITPQWAFNNQWDPERGLDNLLPFASLPSPSNNSCASIQPRLKWLPGRCVVSHLVYLGKQQDSLDFIDNVTADSILPGDLEDNQTYWWRVDEITETGDTVTGETWSFQSLASTDVLPNPVFNPFPAHEADYHTRLVTLTWDIDLCTTDSVAIYFGSDSSNLAFKGVQKYNRYYVSPGRDDSTYYWRIDAINPYGVTEGEVWSFTLNPSSTGLYQTKSDYFKLNSAPNPGNGTAYVSYELPEAGAIQIELFSIQGQLLFNSTPSYQRAGQHHRELDISDYSGILICRLTQGNRTENIRLITQ